MTRKIRPTQIGLGLDSIRSKLYRWFMNLLKISLGLNLTNTNTNIIFLFNSYV